MLERQHILDFTEIPNAKKIFIRTKRHFDILVQV